MEKSTTNGLSPNEQYWLKKYKVPNILRQEIDKHQNKQSVAIDLGCAGGRLTKYIEPLFKKVYGIDLWESLIEKASESNSSINFVSGDFGDPVSWNKINKSFDVIVSDCAIRKDYVNLSHLSDIFINRLKKGGLAILRIQEKSDLNNLLDLKIREKIFFSKQEIFKYFSKFEIEIKEENYKQNFSNTKYIENYLKKINIKKENKNYQLKANRSYILVIVKKLRRPCLFASCKTIHEIPILGKL
jgi:2-polyprenyl-3-methyl-5-hydroxy-6-metoxy-1,4-benzoquinol methylase